MDPNPIDLPVLEQLRSTAGAEFVDELVATFLEEAPPLLAALREAQAGGDTGRFRRAAHSLKSNAQIFGAGRLAEAARTLELGGLPDAADGPAALAALDALEADYAAAAVALRAHADG